MLNGLEGAVGGAINPLGEWEQKVLGKQVAQDYLAVMGNDVDVRVRVTAKSRTVESCYAFRDGAKEIWTPSQEVSLLGESID